nr:uncharacterized protein LOC117864767 [Setaria viridis]
MTAIMSSSSSSSSHGVCVPQPMLYRGPAEQGTPAQPSPITPQKNARPRDIERPSPSPRRLLHSTTRASERQRPLLQEAAAAEAPGSRATSSQNQGSAPVTAKFYGGDFARSISVSPSTQLGFMLTSPPVDLEATRRLQSPPHSRIRREAPPLARITTIDCMVLSAKETEQVSEKQKKAS